MPFLLTALLDTAMFTSINVWLPTSLLFMLDVTYTLLETKNTWARDDPAILVLLAACLFGEPSPPSKE